MQISIMNFQGRFVMRKGLIMLRQKFIKGYGKILLAAMSFACANNSLAIVTNNNLAPNNVMISHIVTPHVPAESIADQIEQGAEAGLRQDYVKAFHIFASVASGGNPVAEERLASLFFFGQGTPQSYVDAFNWYARAAAQGVISAQYMVGFAYLRGLGTQANYLKAKQYLENVATLPRVVIAPAAADHGDPMLMVQRLAQENLAYSMVYWKLLAQRDLGEVYQRGLGVDPDPEKAYAWYALVAIHGDAVARSAAMGIATQFSHDELSRAHGLFSDLQQRYGV